MSAANRSLELLLVGALIAGSAVAVAGPGAARTNGKRADDQGGGEITLPPGMVISVRMADTVDSSKNHAGDLLTGMVDPSVLIDNKVVIPRGTEAHMRLMEDKKGGRLHGKASVQIELVALVVNKEKQDVDSDDYGKHQGALAAKAKGEASATASGDIRAAGSTNPAVGATDPIIAIFRPAKVQVPAGTRIPFTLTTTFAFHAQQENEKQVPAQ